MQPGFLRAEPAAGTTAKPPVARQPAPAASKPAALRPLRAPATVLGLPAYDTPAIRASRERTVRDLRADGAPDPVVATYGSKRTGLVAILQMFRGSDRGSEQLYSASQRHNTKGAFDPGQLVYPDQGDPVTCGRAYFDGRIVGVICAWADNLTAGGVLLFGENSFDPTANATAEIRGAVER